MSQKLNTATAVLTTALTLLYSGSAVASDNKITNIKVDGDTVYFSTSHAKSHTLPNCVASANNQQWTLSLKSAAGKASYTLLVAAMTDNRSISVTSANDCANSTGYERAQSVEVGDTIANTTRGSSGQLSLYKWDGVTKVGTIFEIDRSSNPRRYWVLANEDDASLIDIKPHENLRSGEAFFTEPDCRGEVYTQGANSSPGYFGGRLLEIVGEYTFITTSSVLGTSGVCKNRANRNGYLKAKIATNPHPICGFGPCKIKSR
ncbi:hypothetical protein [Pseudoalteromonas aurantia]|uniref:Secreted protein n=1 Tax=Pseudoalteromonas aurantia 208 TaxID=1314867 RepID=A0ABR9EDG6_9GAMM|nr:hypothetical protein [Pseudoalteromonas aurantia]MBE0368300.1 hypothetical protein [Pseudoalteromonas aurantia 208]